MAKGNECFACGKVLKEVIHKEAKIKPIANKMGKDLKEYGKLRKQFLEDNPMCAVFPKLKAVEVHHKKGRGKYLLDTTTWLAVSQEGHNKIHDYPVWAVENNFKILRSK